MFEKDEAYYRQRLQEIEDEEKNKQPAPSSVISEEEALEYGIIHEGEEEYAETAPENEERYEKLSLGQTAVDVGKSVGVEALHFFQPQKYETQYESKTRLGETVKTLYKWGVGIGSIMATGGIAGGAMAAVKGASLAVKGVNAAGKGLKILLGGKDLIKTGVNASKWAKRGAAAVNGAVSGLLADAIACFTLYNSEEDGGHLADMFGETNNKLISFLQTKPDDTEFEAKMKNVAENVMIDLPLGAAVGVALQKPLENFLKGVHGTVNAQTTEGAAKALIDTARAKIALENVANTLDLAEAVDTLRKEAAETGEEVSQLIIDRMPPTKIEEARAIAVLREEGEEIFPYSDGTWSIKVTKWEDAYKVTPEQYAEQLKSLDETGNFGISQMNEAVKSTWRERGLIAGNGLLSKNAKERNDTAKAVLRYYKNKFGLGKTKIHLNFGDWSNIPDGRTTRYDNGEIFIQINSNSKDIYAALRSELEHARDLVKGEVPDQNIKHFARYEGVNEAETAPYYIHKKSQSRAKAVELEQYKPISKEELDNYKVSSDKDDAFGIKDPDVIDPDYEPYTIHSITDKEGHNLGHIRITKGNYIDWSSNHGVEKGTVRKLIAKLLYENKYSSLIWDATTKKSVESYERFCREFPDLVDRIQFTDKFNNGLDSSDFLNYTQGKGILNEGSQGNNPVSGRGEVLSGNNRADNPQTISEAGGNQRTNGADKSRILDESNPTANERGKIANTDNEKGLRPEEGQTNQLKPDFNTSSPETTAAAIAKGELKFTSTNDVAAVTKQILADNPEISGKTFKDVAQDADSYFNQAMRDNPQKAAAYFDAKNPDEVDQIVREQLAAVEFASLLRDIEAKAPAREKLRIYSAVKAVNKYIDHVGSRIAAALRYQSIVNKAADIFGAEKLSDLALEGINGIADILNRVSLSFTRNMSLKDFKKEILTAFKDHPAYLDITGDKKLSSKLNEAMEETYHNLKAGKNIDPVETLTEIILKDTTEELSFYAKLCDNTGSWIKTIVNNAGGVGGYIANNLLTFGSLCKGVSSAVVQNGLFPSYKIIGGLLPWNNGEITREGIDEITCTLVNMGEAARLAKQAWINGEGLLVTPRELLDGAWQNSLGKWGSIKENGWGITLKNLYTIIPRAMVCTDEFFSQLMYRNIKRAEALRAARKNAPYSDQTVKELADDIFRKAFNEAGQATDAEAAYTAKQSLFQNSLDRTIYDPAAGKKVSTGDPQTLITKTGQAMESAVQKLPILRAVFTFIKTPVNIANEVIRSNPVYMVLNPKIQSQLTSKNPEVRAKMQGKLAVMSALYGLGVIGAGQGYITGSPPVDRKEKAALYKTGWRPYSINWNGKWYSYMGVLTPLDSVLAICADSVALAEKNLTSEQRMGWGEMGLNVLGMIMNDYIDQSGFRTNTSKLMDILNPSLDKSRRDSVFAQLASEFLPWSGNVKTVNKAIKTLKGDTEQKQPETFYEQLVQNYIDVFASTQDYKRDVFGNRVDYYNLIITGATDDMFMQPEYTEMARLAEKGYTPSDIGKMLSETGVPLTEFKSRETGRSAYDAMYDELTETRLNGKTLQEAVAELIQTRRYQSLPDGINTDGMDWSTSPYKTKTKLLNDLYQKYYKKAKRNVINKRGDEFEDKDGMTMKARQKTIQIKMLSEKNAANLNQNLVNQVNKF